MLNARLCVEENFDGLGPDPAVAHALYAQEVGAAGLAELQRETATACLFASSEISV